MKLLMLENKGYKGRLKRMLMYHVVIIGGINITKEFIKLNLFEEVGFMGNEFIITRS